MTTHAHHPDAPGHISEFLPAYLNGTLALSGPHAPTSAAIAAHLRECPACRQELAAWTAIAHAVPAVSPIATPATPTPGALDALMAAIATPPRPQPFPTRSTPALPPLERPMPDPIALRPPMPADRWSWTRTRTGSLGLIAAVLLLIASVAIISAPDPDPEPSRLPVIAAASPDATALTDTSATSPSVQIVPDAIDIAECTTEPRPAGTVAGLLKGGIVTPPPYFEPEMNPGGEPPSATTVAGIEAALRQFVACRYENDVDRDVGVDRRVEDINLDDRFFALFSDAYMVQFAEVLDGGTPLLPFFPFASTPLTIAEARAMPDGSVIVRLDTLAGYRADPPYEGGVTLVFVEEHGKWVVNQWSWTTFTQGGSFVIASVQEPEPQLVSVVATEDRARVWPSTGAETLTAGIDVTLTVANLGPTHLHFAIPALDFETDVPPGHSVDLRVNLPAGTYPIDAIPDGGDDLVSGALTLHPDSDAPATPEPQSPNVRIRPQDEAIDIAECTTEPRPPGTVAQMREALRGTPEIGLPRSSQAYDWAPSLGWPEPDPETRLGIEETLRQLVACRFWPRPPGDEPYDMDSRYLALFSDRYVVGLAIEREGDGVRPPFFPYDSAPLTIVDIAEHEDGRVLVSLGDDLPGFTGTVYVLFEMLDGRWVVDDWADLRFDGPFQYSTPAAALPEPRMPAKVTVIATDEFGQTWQEPWGEGEPLPAGTEVTFTVVNFGGTSLRFEIPGLIGATDVAAGHSVDLRVIAPPGTYSLDAIPEGGEDLINGGVTFQSNPGTPAPPPVDDASPDHPDSRDVTSTPDAAASVQIIPDTIDIAECTTAPRPPGTVAGLLAAQGGAATPRAVQPYEVSAELPEPPAETLTAIEATLHQIVACRYEGFEQIIAPEGGSIDFDGRLFALYSDRFVTEFAAVLAGGVNGNGLDVLTPPFSPINSTVLTIQDARQARDGSVVVAMAVPAGFGEGTSYGATQFEMRFVSEGDRWLVDSWGLGTSGWDMISGDAIPPTLQAVQVVVGSAEVIVSPPSDEVRLSASKDTIVSVANLRDVPLDFAFPALAFSVTVNPGHSVDLHLSGVVGIQPINAIPAGGSDLNLSSLIFWPDQTESTPEPQAATTDSATNSPYVRIRTPDEAIDSAECTTEARTPGTVAQLRAAHGGTPEPGIPTPNPLLNMGDFFDPTLDGAEAAPETIAAIESTLRQLVACRSAGMATLGTAEYDLDSRHLALFSDRYVVGLVMEMESGIFRLPFAPYDSAPLPIIAAVDRPEGVLVRLGAVPGYGEQTVHLLMVQENGKWVIDDWANFIVCASPNSAPQRAPRATGVEMPQVLPIVATDGFATIWQTPELDPLHAGTDVIITVANLGEGSIRFEIAGLGFATDIAAGHSLDLVVNAPAGTYPLTLSQPGTPDILDADLTLEPEPSGTPIPTCSP